MKVYLDTNIFAGIEAKRITKDHISNKLGADKIEYYYSDEHVREAHASIHNAPSKEEGVKVVIKRLCLINELCENNYLSHSLTGDIVTFKKSPCFRFLQINDYASEELIKQGFQGNMPDAMRELYREVFDFPSAQVLNNEAPEKIISVLDKCLIEKQSKASSDYQQTYGTSLKELEQIYFQQLGGKPDNYQKIVMIFLVLDLCGYWKDAETEKSDFARMYDSAHADWATYCDYFISNDKRTRMKTQVAFHYLNTCYNARIKTQVIELKT